jgi:hypothetical protein
VLEELEDSFGWRIESVAHRGDTVESMAYAPKQIDKLTKRLADIHGRGEVPTAVLLSAGGNDIAGSEFATLLNHHASGLSPLNDDVLRGVIDVRLATAIRYLAQTITELCMAIFHPPAPMRMLIHGYDYAIPDGRGFWGGWGPLPGPWLRPGFEQKGYQDLAPNAAVIHTMIDRFNTMLVGLAGQGDLGHLRYVNLRGTLSGQLGGEAYKQDWHDELHPRDSGFARIAEKFNAAVLAP